MRNRLAVCVPTKDNHENVRLVLDQCISNYQKYGIDIYYYDSSIGTETKEVVCEYSREFSNIFYCSAPKNYCYGEKIDYIFGDLNLKNYDYIWPIKDRAYCNEKMLQRIIDGCDDDCDIVFPVNTSSHEGIFNMVSATEFYGRYAVQATSLESAIYRRQTMLNEYLHGTIYNYDKPLWDFWHYRYLFTRLQEVIKPCIRIIAESDAQLLNVPKRTSYWEKDIFVVWKDYWINVNEALPENYDIYKPFVIKNTASIVQIFGGRDRLIQLHNNGILTSKNLPFILDRWELVSDVPKHVVKQIAEDNYDIFHDPTQLCSVNEVGQILQEIHTLLYRGIGLNDIPIDDIERLVLTEVMNEVKYSKEKKRLMCGSVKDICDYIRNGDMKDAMKYVQMLFMFVQ